MLVHWLLNWILWQNGSIQVTSCIANFFFSWLTKNKQKNFKFIKNKRNKPWSESDSWTWILQAFIHPKIKKVTQLQFNFSHFKDNLMFLYRNPGMKFMDHSFRTWVRWGDVKESKHKLILYLLFLVPCFLPFTCILFKTCSFKFQTINFQLLENQ